MPGWPPKGLHQKALYSEKNIQETSTIVKYNSTAPEENIEFHYLIAEATHNSVIALATRTLFDVSKEMTLEIKENLSTRAENSRYAMGYRKKILKALREKDSQRVYELMLKHIFEIQEGLKGIKYKSK